MCVLVLELELFHDTHTPLAVGPLWCATHTPQRHLYISSIVISSSSSKPNKRQPIANSSTSRYFQAPATTSAPLLPSGAAGGAPARSQPDVDVPSSAKALRSQYSPWKLEASGKMERPFAEEKVGKSRDFLTRCPSSSMHVGQERALVMGSIFCCWRHPHLHRRHRHGHL